MQLALCARLAFVPVPLKYAKKSRLFCRLYFHVVLFIMLYKVVLTSKFVHEALVCDHSNISFRVAFYSNFVDKFKV